MVNSHELKSNTSGTIPGSNNISKELQMRKDILMSETHDLIAIRRGELSANMAVAVFVSL